MSTNPNSFDDTVYLVAYQRRHHLLHTPDHMLIVRARDGYLVVGSRLQIYVVGFEEPFAAIMGELHVTTPVSHIRRAHLISQSQDIYLSFSHHPRYTTYFPGHICIVHHAEREEDYEL